MYHHHIQEMTASLVEAGLIQDEQAAENLLSQCWQEKIAVVWTIEDVHGIQKDFDSETEKSSLSDEQAQEILLSVFEHQGLQQRYYLGESALLEPGIFGGIVCS